MTPTPIYKDHTGQWREKNPFPEFNEYCIAQDIEYSKNPKWEQFEQSVTYHQFPNAPDTKPGEVVMARLQWQFKQFYEENYRDCGESVYEIYKTFEEYQTASAHYYDTRQIWVSVTDSAKEELPNIEWDSNTLNPDNYDGNGSPIVASAPKAESAEAKMTGPEKFRLESEECRKVLSDSGIWKHLNLSFQEEITYCMRKYATLKTSSLQQENDKLRDEIIDEFDYETTYTKHDIIRILNALNKQ